MPLSSSMALLLQATDPQLPPSTTAFVVSTIVKLIVVFTVYMVAAALLTILERKVCAWMQDRLGPNRTPLNGWGQPLADGVKNFMKEETIPGNVNKPLFIMAPMLAFIVALISW